MLRAGWLREEADRKQLQGRSWKFLFTRCEAPSLAFQTWWMHRSDWFVWKKNSFHGGGQWPCLEKIIWSLHFSECRNNERESSKSSLFLLLWTDDDPPADNSPQRSERVFTEERRCWMMNNGEEDAAGWRGWWSLPAWSFYASRTSLEEKRVRGRRFAQ